MAAKKCCSASTPPADAPMPQTRTAAGFDNSGDSVMTLQRRAPHARRCTNGITCLTVGDAPIPPGGVSDQVMTIADIVALSLVNGR